MKKIIILWIVVAPLIAKSQIEYKGGMEKFNRLLAKGLRPGFSWKDSALLTSRIYLVQLTIQPNGTISTCSMLARAAVDSEEVAAIYNTMKKTDSAWQNSSGKIAVVFVPYIFIKQGARTQEEVDSVAKKLYAGFKFISYAGWMPVKPLIAEPIVVYIGNTMRKKTLK